MPGGPPDGNPAQSAIGERRLIPPRLQAFPGVTVQETGVLHPVKITEPKPGVFVFDIGQNFAGFARLKVRGPAGTKLVLRFAEMLNPDGTIYTNNLRAALGHRHLHPQRRGRRRDSGSRGSPTTASATSR